jgi:hypothetical protein
MTKVNFTDISALCDEFGFGFEFEFEFENSSYRLCKVETAIENPKTEMRNLFEEIAKMRQTLPIDELQRDVSVLKCQTLVSNSLILSDLYGQRTDWQIVSDIPKRFNKSFQTLSVCPQR